MRNFKASAMVSLRWVSLLENRNFQKERYKVRGHVPCDGSESIIKTCKHTSYSVNQTHESKINFAQWQDFQFSHSAVSDSLRPRESQHARPPCPSPTPGVYRNPCPLSRWCHPTISSSVVPFSSCPQSLPASGSFQMSQLFTSGGQSTGVSASTSVLPMNIQDWSPLGWTSCISLQSKGLSRLWQNVVR